MAPLDPPEKRVPDPYTELKTRILNCALTEFAIHGPARTPQAKSRRRSPRGNLAFCRSWVSKWVKALAGTPHFPVPASTRGAKRIERQAAAMTKEVISFDPKITGARVAGRLFVKLFTGEASIDQVVTPVAEERLRLGEARDDMHAYFAMLANRVGVEDSSESPYDETLFGFLAGPRGEVVLTPESEPALRARVRESSKLINPVPVEDWLDQHWSQEAQIRRRREQLADLGDRMPHFPGRVQSAPQPENHDFAAANHALQAFIEAGDPVFRDALFRREWATALVWLAEIAMNPDRVWRGRTYKQGAIPRSWLWLGIENDPEKRARFNGLVAAALDVLGVHAPVRQLGNGAAPTAEAVTPVAEQLAAPIEGTLVLGQPAAAVRVVSPAPAKARRTRPGRPMAGSPDRDRKIAEAWATGQHSTFEELGRPFGLDKKQARQAVDRHRKRAGREQSPPPKPPE